MKLFLLSFFILTHAFAEPCGLEGSIDERIKSCNTAKGDFVLVARSEKNLEIYKDTKTNLIWGDRISTDFNHYGSQRACTDDLADGLLIKDLKWRLPTIREFETAASHGMKTSISNMGHWFWTSTPVKVRTKRRRRLITMQAFLWDGVAEKSDAGDLKDAASVRCVSSAK